MKKYGRLLHKWLENKGKPDRRRVVRIVMTCRRLSNSKPLCIVPYVAGYVKLPAYVTSVSDDNQSTGEMLPGDDDASSAPVMFCRMRNDRDGMLRPV